MGTPRYLVVVGLGQLGRLFATGALARGVRVTPVLRGVDPGAVLAPLPDVPILLAVGEHDLEPVLRAIAPARRRDAILVQNETFPPDWRPLVPDPTVAVVWLNAKPGRPLQVARSTAVRGRHAALVCALHAPLDVPCRLLDDDAQLARELVAKYALILAVNALGLRSDETVGTWLARDEPLVRRLVADARRLGEARLGDRVDDADAAEDAALEAMQALATMPARGRTARARVDRALALGRTLGVSLPALAAFADGA